MWSLFEKEGEKIKELKPLKFSNNKTQEDIVNEVIKAIKEGHKVIFIKGVCGTGKSAIALNIAKELGKTSIVVPVKNLQKQYEQDYTQDKFLMGDNKEKLKISVITGRQNFKCPFLENYNIKINKKEQDSKLDIFSTSDGLTDQLKKLKKDKSCDNPLLP